VTRTNSFFNIQLKILYQDQPHECCYYIGLYILFYWFWLWQLAAGRILKFACCWGGWGEHSCSRALRQFTQWSWIKHLTFWLKRRTLYYWATAAPYYILTHFNGFSQSSFIKPYFKVLTFLNVAISVKAIWTWSTSAKCMRQRKRKENIIMEQCQSIIKCAVIQMTFGHGPKVLYIKWSKGPSSGQFYAAATETLLLA